MIYIYMQILLGMSMVEMVVGLNWDVILLKSAFRHGLYAGKAEFERIEFVRMSDHMLSC